MRRTQSTIIADLVTGQYEAIVIGNIVNCSHFSVDSATGYIERRQVLGVRVGVSVKRAPRMRVCVSSGCKFKVNSRPTPTPR